MVLERPLALPKRGGVVVPAPVLHDRGHIVVKHLVKHHRLDEVARHPRLVQHRVHPDEFLLGEVRPELE